jgi:hypothetical protein
MDSFSSVPRRSKLLTDLSKEFLVSTGRDSMMIWNGRGGDDVFSNQIEDYPSSND